MWLSKKLFPAVIILLSVGCLSLLLLQYPLQRYFYQNKIDRIFELESDLIQNPSDKDALDQLVKYSNGSSGPVKSSAIRSLGRIDATDFDEVTHLAKLLSHHDHGTRRAAILALKDQSDKAIDAMPEIIQSLKDPDAIDVPVMAAQVLRSFGAKAESALPALKSVRDDPNFSAFTSDFNRAIEMIESDLESK